METYSILREFADSWFLLVLFSFFIGTWVFAFWPSLAADREKASQIPLRDEAASCQMNCANCTCKDSGPIEVEND